MKKIIFSALLLAGGVAFANAQTMIQAQAPATEQVAVEGDYRSAALADMNETVQGAIQKLAGDTSDVKTVEYNEAKELTRVTLVNKSDKSEQCVVLDNAGKEVTQAAAPTAE